MYIYDFEVLRYDWLVVFYHTDFHDFICYHNNEPGLQQFMADNRDSTFIGFNSKHYDQWIMKTILVGGDNEDVKAMNDYLISGGNGWEHPFFRQGEGAFFHNVDIMDDMQKGLSLKAIEGHLGMSIEESDVPFDLDRPLTEAELNELITYCKHDVEATYEIVKLRKNYLDAKLSIGQKVGLDPAKALAMTNAKLTATYLHATPPAVPYNDERQYVYPDNLKREYIPQEVFDYFNRLYDPSISDEAMFSEKLTIHLGDAEATIGFGGIHLGIPNYMWGREVMQR